MPNIDTETLMDALIHIELSLFPADLEEELRQVGAPEDVIQRIVVVYRLCCQSSLIRLYRDYAYKAKDEYSHWRKYLSAIVGSQIEKYIQRCEAFETQGGDE